MGVYAWPQSRRLHTWRSTCRQQGVFSYVTLKYATWASYTDTCSHWERERIKYSIGTLVTSNFVSLTNTFRSECFRSSLVCFTCLCVIFICLTKQASKIDTAFFFSASDWIYHFTFKKFSNCYVFLPLYCIEFIENKFNSFFKNNILLLLLSRLLEIYS